MTPDRALLVEQVAKIIAPPFRFSDGTEFDGDWTLWLEEAEAIVGLLHYLSTACQHDQHEECRRACKFCEQPCKCTCHADDDQQVRKVTA